MAASSRIVEADRLRAMALTYRNKSLEKQWTFSAVFDFLKMAAEYELAAANMELAEAIATSNHGKPYG